MALLSVGVSSCQDKAKKAYVNPLGIVEEEASESEDLADIQTSGILIVGTISGPDTYFDYRGRAMGLQYGLIENFAISKGLEVRVELAHDTISLIEMLKQKKVDVIAYELPHSLVNDSLLLSAGAHASRNDSVSWAVRADADQLASAIDAWYSDSVRALVTAESVSATEKKRYVRRNARPLFVSQADGVISPYDTYFVQEARSIGWDWRLLSAVAYQESAFDPDAVSWAGARGLMQIMPRTADEIGLARDDMHNPQANISAGARYLKKLYNLFSDIPVFQERVKFALASYNGGYLHIRDAMALASKNGKNSHNWDSVAPFVLGLSRPEYYNDPVVKYGYMIGSETHNYVYSIMQRWQKYGGSVTSAPMPSSVPQSKHAVGGKRNRFTKDSKVMTPEELEHAIGREHEHSNQ